MSLIGPLQVDTELDDVMSQMFTYIHEFLGLFFFFNTEAPVVQANLKLTR